MTQDHRLTPDEVDARIETWHNAVDGGNKNTSLHEYLGWTWEEMKRWVEKGIIP